MRSQDPSASSPGHRRLPRLAVSLALCTLGSLAACGADEVAEPTSGEQRPASSGTDSGEHAPGRGTDDGGSSPHSAPAEAAATEPAAVLPGERAIADERFASKYALSSAALDDWETEQLSEAIGAALAPLREWLKHPPGERPTLEALASADLHCSPLRPAALETVFEGPAFAILRARGLEAASSPPAADLSSELGRLLEAFEGAPAQHVKLKLVAVSAPDDTGSATGAPRAHARFLVHATGPRAAGEVQINAVWETAFELDATGTPRLASLRVTEYEEVHGVATAAGAAFEDITEAVLGGNAAYAEQLAIGLDTWAGRVDAALGMSLIGHAGLAVGDANGDGLDDLYVCQTGGLPNLLFLRAADGTATESSAASGVNFLDGSRSALFLDLDGDGDQDLVVECDPVLLLLENDGRAHFTLRAEVPAPATTSLSAADFDGDGDLDLYACGYMLPDSEHRTPIPYHDANNGRPNKLLRNDLDPAEREGPWVFTDVTRASGLDRNNRRYTFAAAWEDYDDDGDPDLYVANDFGRNNLYRNDGGQFVDVAAEAGVEDISAGMGVAWSDLDRDGRMDLYVSNMFSSAGGRIAYQRRFHADESDAARGQYQRHSRGNTLFRNLGDGQFADVSERAGVTMGRWAWGSIALDLQNDGWPDLFVPNGFVTGPDPADL